MTDSLHKVGGVLVIACVAVPLLLQGQQSDDAKRLQAERDRTIRSLVEGRRTSFRLEEMGGPKLDQVRLNRSLTTSKATSMEWWEDGKQKGTIKFTKTAIQADAPSDPAATLTRGQVIGAVEYTNGKVTFPMMLAVAKVGGKWEGALLDRQGRVVSLAPKPEGDTSSADRFVEELRSSMESGKEMQRKSAPRAPEIIGEHSCIRFVAWGYWCDYRRWPPSCWWGWGELFRWCWDDWSQYFTQNPPPHVRDQARNWYGVQSGSYIVSKGPDGRVWTADDRLNNTSPLTQVTP